MYLKTVFLNWKKAKGFEILSKNCYDQLLAPWGPTTFRYFKQSTNKKTKLIEYKICNSFHVFANLKGFRQSNYMLLQNASSANFELHAKTNVTTLKMQRCAVNSCRKNTLNKQALNTSIGQTYLFFPTLWLTSDCGRICHTPTSTFSSVSR